MYNLPVVSSFVVCTFVNPVSPLITVLLAGLVITFQMNNMYNKYCKWEVGIIVKYVEGKESRLFLFNFKTVFYIIVSVIESRF